MDRIEEQRATVGDPNVITEKRFAQAYHSFWHTAIPMATSYVRRRNLHLTRFAEPLTSVSGDNRGLINETAFRLFAQSCSEGTTVQGLSPDVTVASMNAALQFIWRFRERSRAPLDSLSESGAREAMLLARRLEACVGSLEPSRLVVSPRFAGCGWLDECNGDLLLDNMLCEVKSPDGKFRGWDIRQLLVYAALNFQSRAHDIVKICLINARVGVLLVEDLESLSLELSGVSATDLLGEIVAFVSEPRWTDTIA